MFLHLAYPSEVIVPTIAIQQLNWDSAFGIIGRILLVVLALSPFALRRAGLGVAGIVYVASAIVLMMNDYSWIFISKVTGNLGFRIFWSIPLPIIVSVTIISLMRHFIRLSSNVATSLSFLVLSLALYYNSTLPLISRIMWHLPDLKVDRTDYDLAKRLADQTYPGCAILAPERYSALISMMEKCALSRFCTRTLSNTLPIHIAAR